jgi:ABC-2 type transport system permease protein
VTLVINVVLVTTMDDRGPSVLAGAFVYFFSGMVIPLAFFPDVIRPWLRAQPLAGIVDIPYSIYFGGIAGWGAAGAIALQFFWVAMLAVAGRWGLERSMRKLQVQGG